MLNSFAVVVRAVAVAAAGVVVSHSARAQTFADLQAAVDAAESGSTVYVENDMTFDRPLEVPDGKAITIVGTNDTVFTLSRDTGYANGTFFLATNGVRNLTVKHLVLDLTCEGTKVQLTHRVISVEADNSSFTLGNGAKICNAYQGGPFPGCMFSRWGKVVMEPGSEMSDLYNSGYGTAVCVGWKSSGNFIMNGGLITRCHSITPPVYSDAMGGAVYAYGGKFFFNGGTITGNDSTHYVGGVILDQATGSAPNSAGVMLCGGSGVITGNVGKVANDVYCCDPADNIWIANANTIPGMTLYKGATFSVKLAQTSTNEGEVCRAITRAGSSSSAGFENENIGNIYLQDDPSLALDPNGYGESVWYTKWRRKTAVVRTADRTYTRWSLKDALTAGSGRTGVIELWQDCTWTEATGFTLGHLTDLTIRSLEARRTIKMADNSTCGLLRLTDGGDTIKKVRLENIVIDGNKDGGAYIPKDGNGVGDGLILLQRGASLELGPGAVLCNARAESGCAGIRAVSLSTIRMEEGAVISNMVYKWGGVMLLGNGGDKGDFPTINMTGGLITGCSCFYNGTGAGYGGAVYLWHGILNMSGGAITGNDAPTGGTAGIHLEVGSLSVANFTGTARVCNNTGRDMDVFNRGCSLNYSGDFRGLVGISVNSPQTNLAPVDSDATGAWCFYRSSNDPVVDRTQWGYLANTGSVAFGTPVGWIDEWGFVQADDLSVRLSDPEDLSTSEARARLPHVLSGAALAANIAQTLTFDSAEMVASGELPLCLYSFSDGDFTGTVRMTTPVDGKYLWWVARDAIGGVSGIYLARDHRGMAIILR